NIIEVDKNGDKVAVSLSKDGSEIGDMSIVTAGGTYVYEKDLGSSDDVPIIAVHFDQIFQGQESSAIFVDGIFQISDQYITVEDGDTYGKMKVTSTSGEIVMMNDNSISLSKGDSIPIMGDILFKVADDSSNVRYYPYVEISTAPLDSLDISMPTSVKQGDPVSIIVTSRGATVSDVVVKFDDDNVGKTSNDGTLTYKPALSGTYTVTVEKDGYVSASGQVEIISPLDETKKMSIEVSPDVVYEGNQLSISTIKSIGGEVIEGVDVSYDGKSLGTTSSDGTLSYTVKETGMHKIIATKTGLLDAELNLEVHALEAKFEFSNLVMSPLEVKLGKDVTITLNASNNGKAEGDYNVDLMINGNLTESKTVTLAVDESTTIEFTVAKDEPGTYLVEANGLSGTFEVLEKSGGVAFYVLGILGVFAAVAVGYMFTAGGWTVEMVSTKVAEFIESIR
ncbi:MAG TPA: S-layer protein, partial [Methanosarcinaceae archaeon]|nr:S-layer protein [Methanosarcinaceae archaeon]